MKKFIKLVEVYESSSASKKVQTNKEMNKRYSLRDVIINTNNIASICEDTAFKQKQKIGYLPDDLDERQSFSRIQLNFSGNLSAASIVVIGDPVLIFQKINDTDGK